MKNYYLEIHGRENGIREYLYYTMSEEKAAIISQIFEDMDDEGWFDGDVRLTFDEMPEMEFKKI